MPAHQQKAGAQKPASPRNTAKYTNKDGSKFITVPKLDASESSLPSTPTSSKPSELPPTPAEEPAPMVNRKKQKRREKAAAKAAAQMAANGHSTPASSIEHPSRAEPADYEVVNSEDDEDYEYLMASEVNGHSKAKKGKKKKKKEDARLSPLPSHRSGISRDKIWSTSNQEERERIKQFWLNLGEDERKSLVKVEKDAVLKKMKEQQKHTCSCTVCGRKRTAIEEELEGLYDAYYVELEEFANQGEGPPMLAPPRDYAPHSFRAMQPPYPPSRGRIVEHVGDDDDEDDLEEVYSEDEVDDDEYSDDEPPEAYHNPHDRDVADFLTFGNSLQVKGGILTVADDLLKNDGKRFIEMMEQLAERRMAREEDAREHFSRNYSHPNGSYSTPHNHPPPEEDDYEEDEEDEEDYEDSQEDEYEDEEDPMTEEQRMEEGRRMFQIFAARMFEQRVLSAYKEKVAKERQEQLLEELEEETRQEDQQKAKKAKSAAKKKEKAAQKKQALAEDKARKDADKAAEETARLEAEQRKIAEQRQKAEDKRKQREALKKAEEDARLKKEADRQRRIHEQQERQAEQERKAREAKDREKKLKDEQRRQEREARERKELEAQERKEKQERDKREKEARAAKALKEAQDAREAKEKAKEEKAAQKAAPQPPPVILKRNPQTATPVPTVLPQHPPNPANFASPKIPVATPAISKAPTPIRPRTTSQQHETSPIPAQSSPRAVGPPRRDSSSASTIMSQPSQSVSPHGNVQFTRPTQSTPGQLPPMGMVPPPGLGGPPPGFPGHQMFPPGFRHPMMPPPGINGSMGRGFISGPMPPPGFPQDPFPMGQGFGMPKDMPHHGHVRQGSLGFDGAPGTPLQPVGRPAPIGRPGTSISGRPREDRSDETKHLGSRILVEDDEPLPSDPINIRTQPPGLRPGFAPSPFIDAGFMAPNPWTPHSFPNAPPGLVNPTWGAMPQAFGSPSLTPAMPPIRPAQSGLVAVRHLLVQTYRELATNGHADNEGYVDFETIQRQTETRCHEMNVSPQDLNVLIETEGNATNGGGTFDAKSSSHGPQVVRWIHDPSEGQSSLPRNIGAPGQIGSPIVSAAITRGM